MIHWESVYVLVWIIFLLDTNPVVEKILRWENFTLCYEQVLESIRLAIIYVAPTW